jgi:hypothetical protein
VFNTSTVKLEVKVLGSESAIMRLIVYRPMSDIEVESTKRTSLDSCVKIPLGIAVEEPPVRENVA